MLNNASVETPKQVGGMVYYCVVKSLKNGKMSATNVSNMDDNVNDLKQTFTPQSLQTAPIPEIKSIFSFPSKTRFTTGMGLLFGKDEYGVFTVQRGNERIMVTKRLKKTLFTRQSAQLFKKAVLKACTTNKNFWSQYLTIKSPNVRDMLFEYHLWEKTEGIEPLPLMPRVYSDVQQEKGFQAISADFVQLKLLDLYNVMDSLGKKNQLVNYTYSLAKTLESMSIIKIIKHLNNVLLFVLDSIKRGLSKDESLSVSVPGVSEDTLETMRLSSRISTRLFDKKEDI